MEFVRKRGGEVRLRHPVEDVAELKSRFAAVIVAVGPHQLKALLPDIAPDYTYQPINTCYLQYAERREAALPDARPGRTAWCSGCSTAARSPARKACSPR